MLPQGPVLSSLLFKFFIYELHADDIALVAQEKTYDSRETTQK